MDRKGLGNNKRLIDGMMKDLRLETKDKDKFKFKFYPLFKLLN